MELGRFWPVTAAAAMLALATGCHGTRFGKTEPAPWTAPAGVPTAELPLSTRSGDAPVVQASATMPSLLNWAKGDKAAKVPAVEMTTLWRNKIDYLPDPTPGKNGQMNPGLAGQLFLFGPNLQPATAEGKLTVALYDETPRPPGQQPATPEGWEFDKEALKKLRTVDERFGPCYGLFLPWPSYRPDITRIRIAVRYDPEQGYPLYGTETRITLDNRVPGAGAASTEWSTRTVVPGAQPVGSGGPLPGDASTNRPPTTPPTGALTPAPPGFGALAPVPAGSFGGPVIPLSPAGSPPTGR